MARLWVKPYKNGHMKNYVQKGEVIDYVLGADTAPGTVVKIGSLVGVVRQGGLSGETVSVDLKGVFTIAKTAAQAQAQGVILYWDDTAKKTSTSDASGVNVKIGYAFETAAGADATGPVLLER